jgi:hypothetical protein
MNPQSFETHNLVTSNLPQMVVLKKNDHWDVTIVGSCKTFYEKEGGVSSQVQVMMNLMSPN